MASQDTTVDKPSHDLGARKGEHRAEPVDRRRTRTMRDATSINVEDHSPIDPRMPQMPPA